MQKEGCPCPSQSREDREVTQRGGGRARMRRIETRAGLRDPEVGEQLSDAWHGQSEKSGEVMRVVWKDLPTPPCRGMQTNSSFPCSLCCFDSHLAGATVLDKKSL